MPSGMRQRSGPGIRSPPYPVDYACASATISYGGANAPEWESPHQIQTVAPGDWKSHFGQRRLFMAKKKLSHDQKRKQKLTKRANRAREDQSDLAYTGKKFKTDELTPVYFATESAIHEVALMTEGQLTD